MTRALVLLAACGAPAQTTIANEPTSTRAIEPEPPLDVRSCRAVVTKEYDDGHDEFVDPSGKHVVVTTSDQCGLILEPVFFEENSARVVPSSADRPAEMFACLHQTEGTKFRLELIGHATSDEQNPERLALARAQALEQYYTACGVPLLGLTTTAVGAREPVAKDDPERTRTASRRVELLIVEREPPPD